MFQPNSTLRTAVPACLAAAMFGLSSCGGFIKQEQLANDLAQMRDEMRTEMQAGDQEVGDAANRRIDELDSRIAALGDDLQSLSSDFDAKIAQLEARLEVDMPVHFAYDEATIRDGDKPALDRFAEVIREHHPDVLITVEGFTDPAGSEEYNQWLGQQRADAVRQYLIESGGLDAAKVKSASYGEATNRQVNPGAWGDEGMENRRVALVIEYVGGVN